MTSRLTEEVTTFSLLYRVCVWPEPHLLLSEDVAYNGEALSLLEGLSVMCNF